MAYRRGTLFGSAALHYHEVSSCNLILSDHRLEEGVAIMGHCHMRPSRVMNTGHYRRRSPWAITLGRHHHGPTIIFGHVLGPSCAPSTSWLLVLDRQLGPSAVMEHRLAPSPSPWAAITYHDIGASPGVAAQRAKPMAAPRDVRRALPAARRKHTPLRCARSPPSAARRPRLACRRSGAALAPSPSRDQLWVRLRSLLRALSIEGSSSGAAHGRPKVRSGGR